MAGLHGEDRPGEGPVHSRYPHVPCYPHCQEMERVSCMYPCGQLISNVYQPVGFFQSVSRARVVPLHIQSFLFRVTFCVHGGLGQGQGSEHTMAVQPYIPNTRQQRWVPRGVAGLGVEGWTGKLLKTAHGNRIGRRQTRNTGILWPFPGTASQSAASSCPSEHSGGRGRRGK